MLGIIHRFLTIIPFYYKKVFGIMNSLKKEVYYELWKK